MSCSRALGVAGAALAVALAIFGAAPVEAASNPSVLSFTDAVGDSGSAPDLTKVTISGDASTGLISFTVNVTGLQPSTADNVVREADVFLDTDRDSSTGGDGGAEYDLYVWTDGVDTSSFNWDISRWNGSSWEEVPTVAGMNASRSGDDYTIVTPVAALGGATRFDVFGAAFAWDASGNQLGIDKPDGFLRWLYDIAGPTRSMTVMTRPVLGAAKVAPARVSAGARVTVSFPVTWSAPAHAPASAVLRVAAAVSVGGRTVAHATSLTNRVARVSFVAPRTAHGRQAVVKVTVTAPSWQDASGSWIDAGTGETGVLATLVAGQPATKVIRIAIR